MGLSFLLPVGFCYAAVYACIYCNCVAVILIIAFPFPYPVTILYYNI